VSREGESPEPSIDARSIESVGAGERADFLLVDDIVDQRNSREPEQRKKIIEIFDDTWMSRLDPFDAAEGLRGLALYIATPWYRADCTEVLMERPGWSFLLQRVSDDLTHLEAEVIGAGDDYPGLTS
jgi:hypothetical protein